MYYRDDVITREVFWRVYRNYNIEGVEESSGPFIQNYVHKNNYTILPDVRDMKERHRNIIKKFNEELHA